MKLYEKYYEFYTQLQKKYKNVALLLQVGGFYEIYCDKDNNRSNAQEICRIMNIKLSTKDPRYKDGPKMGGFPIDILDKYKRVLVNNGFTIVVVNQIPLNKKVNFLIVP